MGGTTDKLADDQTIPIKLKDTSIEARDEIVAV